VEPCFVRIARQVFPLRASATPIRAVRMRRRALAERTTRIGRRKGRAPRARPMRFRRNLRLTMAILYHGIDGEPAQPETAQRSGGDTREGARLPRCYLRGSVA
jgi:hypothetical protein